MCGSPIELDSETLGDGTFLIVPSLQSGSDQTPNRSPSSGTLYCSKLRLSVALGGPVAEVPLVIVPLAIVLLAISSIILARASTHFANSRQASGYRPCLLHKVLKV